ncbi:hypothetical protein KEM48_013644 [Puccinia striiformis f. sp. tritici PST-130]|uniref:Uncharacterized protein n=1 Tax=Puccinia striiformis f. sp. tritici PST-78 TaxID=1165861 RepID=A0A0L0VB39_9BASI|nr:hypothetical protein H4Q26_014819 [Puccinia striiformis f. sp. tritici PST-130]KAI9630745.1 hypothetical protein KEM48_013644 [Puccinia striiformis f. sp. tritici PST-130]KNE96473.1 hypothetical protein PSTG_10180 [Puccinia striiformis f. sp. tritici PST-78]
MSNTVLVVQVRASDMKRTISLSIAADFVGYARMMTGKGRVISTPHFVGYARTKAPQSFIHHSASIKKVATYYDQIKKFEKTEPRHMLNQNSSGLMGDRMRLATQILTDDVQLLVFADTDLVGEIQVRALGERKTINLSIAAPIGYARDVLVLGDDLPNHSSNLVVFDPTHNLA